MADQGKQVLITLSQNHTKSHSHLLLKIVQSLCVPWIYGKVTLPRGDTGSSAPLRGSFLLIANGCLWLKMFSFHCELTLSPEHHHPFFLSGKKYVLAIQYSYSQ